MVAEILSVGTELLLGEILNTDAKFLAEELSLLGINVYYQTVVGDNPKRLREAFSLAKSRADLVIASGGLGPTPDDITKEIIAEEMGRELVLDEKSLENIVEYHKKSNREMPKSNIKQAMMPKDSIILYNNHGTAPGCIIEEGEKIAIVLPGPPRELTAMYSEWVKPYLLKKSDGTLYSKDYRLFGIGEAKVAEMLADLMEGKNPTLAPYALTSEVRLRLTAFSKNEENAKELIKKTDEEIKSRLGEFIYSEEDKDLPRVVAEKLIEKNLTISAGESCTGGMFSKMLVDISGVSKILSESFVTYSNEAKQKYLSVSADTLKKYGAVSEETAREMAEGLVKNTGSDIGVSITGIAGPQGESEEKPVGLVYIGIAYKNEVTVKKLNLVGSRERIRYTSCLNAFFEVLKKIK